MYDSYQLVNGPNGTEYVVQQWSRGGCIVNVPTPEMRKHYTAEACDLLRQDMQRRVTAAYDMIENNLPASTNPPKG